MPPNEPIKNPITRRHWLLQSLQGISLLAMGSVFGIFTRHSRAQKTVWQIDPIKCIACGNCATNCVMEESAVKCVHAFALCGYCDLCTGFFEPEPEKRQKGAENELCPTSAINRRFVEEPYHEYTIDEKRCNGCGKCVKGCNTMGNGSLFLQVRHDRCLNCNECSIAVACPSQAFRRIPAEHPYLLKGANHAG